MFILVFSIAIANLDLLLDCLGIISRSAWPSSFIAFVPLEAMKESQSLPYHR